MAKVALIGASGAVGSRLLKELSGRGHTVTGIARNPEKIAALPGVAARKGDVFDMEGLAKLIRGHDVVISSVHFLDSDADTLIAAVRASGVKRYLVVGGAGSLEVSPGKRLVDTPEFPDIYKAEAQKGADFLDKLKTIDDLDWTFLSPSAMFIPGERTGKLRLGKDTLLASDKGSSISFEDYAIAMVDEIEKPAYIKQRFTVGY
ncbi:MULTISPECIES: NAD(P)-dependent oxidoreductase [unclassified Mesorhizobium]|uniref:NAD(P)-dependent oxidoreductase n=1 Tax=unclassified Mesorhizobium TaxID=325217 RepID=UPI00112C96A8|nr:MULTISPECIES: NAD(P)-dependent oxidoreductase [unclassified Mesorhizobium]MCA0059691.1 NAD(P)-dependent oxidoreductase [Mesorhizobium sp. B261B1A]TPK39637.1 NAD(P)-dependent oxidoreductase [Mesorhizobium sp. B2-5-3]TPL09180.1 NAD(P)-dependent oxidoreductase [Mesorhizobium sp. B2-4-11]TPM21466.1 NAD(P)-dependent oxidoreductase [Mesorhizobium sp. B2-3-6]